MRLKTASVYFVYKTVIFCKQGAVDQLVSLLCVDNWGSWKANAEERIASVMSKLFYLHVWQLRVALGWHLCEALAAYLHMPFPCGPLAHSQNDGWVPRASIPNRQGMETSQAWLWWCHLC